MLKWSPRLRHTDIKICKQTISRTAVSNEDNDNSWWSACCLTNLKIYENTKCSWSFRIIRLEGFICVGVCQAAQA
jgi:hypothetical protein